MHLILIFLMYLNENKQISDFQQTLTRIIAPLFLPSWYGKRSAAKGRILLSVLKAHMVEGYEKKIDHTADQIII